MDIFEIIEEETYLSGDELLDKDAVKDDLCYIAAISNEVDEWIDSIGIDTAVEAIIQKNSNPYLGIEKYIAEMVGIMERNGSSMDDIEKCASNIYEQYKVPTENRKAVSVLMNR